MYSEMVEPGKCRGIVLTQSYFCKSRDSFTVILVTLNPDSCAPTLAGVPSCVFQNHPLSQCCCFKSCLFAKWGHRWKQMTVLEPDTLVTVQRLVLAERAEGIGGDRQHGDLPQPGFRKTDIGFWHGTMLRHFKCRGRSQKYVLIPKEACRLQLHFVNFNRKAWVAFRNCGLGVYPASHFCLNKTSAQPTHTYPGANLKQPWWVNGIIPGLSVQQEEISMNETIFFPFNGNK